MIKVAGNNVLVGRTRIKACLEFGLGSKVEVKDVLTGEISEVYPETLDTSLDGYVKAIETISGRGI